MEFKSLKNIETSFRYACSASSSSSVALLLQYVRWCSHSDLRKSSARRYTSLMEASR